LISDTRRYTRYV